MLQKLVFESVESLYCFRTPSSKKWFVYDAKQEFLRMTEKLGSDCPWIVSEANKNFKICETYPPHIIVPKDITDTDLKKVGIVQSTIFSELNLLVPRENELNIIFLWIIVK